MRQVIGFDSRHFIRKVVKKDGTPGEFISVVGFGIRVNNYDSFEKHYHKTLIKIFEKYGLKKDYNYYCVNDLKDEEKKDQLIEEICLELGKEIDKIHVFYTLFSPKKIKEIKVYGRYATKNKLKLSKGTMDYKELTRKHLVNVFPSLCAWKLLNYLSPPIQFHLDHFEGHICEAYEELEGSPIDFLVFTSGDCTNPTISTADLFLHFLDKRLEKNKLNLIFENIRKAMPEFGEKVLAYGLHNKHLSKITPIDSIPVKTLPYLARPVWWFFKGDPLLNSGDLKRSKPYRALLDIISVKGGSLKLFSKNKDSKFLRDGDKAIYMNEEGKESIRNQRKIGKKLDPINFDMLVPVEDSSI